MIHILKGPNEVEHYENDGPRILFVGRAGSGKDTAASAIGNAMVEEIPLDENPMAMSGMNLEGAPTPKRWKRLTKDGNPPFSQIALADPIRSMVSSGFNVSMDILFDPQAKNEAEVGLAMGASPRRLMQLVGQSLREGIGEDIWLEYLIKTASNIESQSPHTALAVTDVRYANEFDKLRDAWATRVLAIGISGRGAEVESHESEDQVDDLVKRCDIEIDNSGSVEDFERKVVEAVDHWFPNFIP